MLQTPEIFTVSLFKPKAVFGSSDLTTTKNTSTEIHTYHAGDRVQFSLYIKGPPGVKPQDIKSYTISVYGKEKPGLPFGNPNDSPKPIEVKVLDIISSIDILNLFKNASPLNVSIIKQDDKGVFNAATGNIFNLTFPDSRYLGNTSGKVQLIAANSMNYAPENACSADSDKICGSNTLNISNCVTYKCWRFTKGSQVAKDCCRGIVKYADSDQLASSSSSGTPLIPTPQCNKNTKQIECKSTNIFYVPYCNKRYIPDCLEESNSSGKSSSSDSPVLKPVCKPPSASSLSSSGSSSNSSSSNNSSSSSSSSGSSSPVGDPVCLPIDQSTKMYCNEVANLPYDLRFSPEDYINDFCSYVSDLEEKKGCCTGCGAIYDKVTGLKDISQDVNEISSCIDYNADGGYCDNFKRSETCVKEDCYKKEYGSDDLKGCCIANDKEAMKAYQLVMSAQLSEDEGMIYNIVTFGNNVAQRSLKILKSTDNLIAQNFELDLPDDPDIDNVIIRAACEDAKGKIYNTELNITLIPNENKTTIVEEGNKLGGCFQPTISSLKVTNGGSITVVKNEPVEIPLIITDAELDLNSVKVTGLSSDFKSEELNKAAGYNFTLISGTPKTSGKFTVTATAEDNCKPTKFTFNVLVSDIPIPKETAIVKTDFATAWLPKVPSIGFEILKSILKEHVMTYIKVKYDLPRAIIAGSKTSLEIPSPVSLININPSKLRVTWISSTNKVKVLSFTVNQLPNKKIKLITFVEKDEPEGIAKVILSDVTDIRSIITQTKVNIIKSQHLAKINGMTFDKPIIENYIINQDPGRPNDKLSLKLKITGKNFIDRKVKINNQKVIILKKVIPKEISRFTYAEFRNSEITINKIRIKDNNSTLIIKLKLPKNYKGGKEELFISTPVGQVFTEIQFPKQSDSSKAKSKSTKKK